MKRLILLFCLSIFYLAACTNSNTHAHDGDHTHEEADHAHDDDVDHAHDHDADEGHDDDHEHGDDHDHPHEQESFSVESDTLKQDSLKNQQK